MTDVIHTLLVITIIQLTLTGANPTFGNSLSSIQPPMDKRYPLFDFIASKVSEEHSQEQIRQSLTIIQILQYGNTLLESQTHKQNYDPQTHRDVKNDLEYLENSVKILKNGKRNCDLQRKLNDNLHIFSDKYADEKIRKLFNADDNETMERFDSIHHDYAMAMRREFKKALNELYDQLPAIIEHFVESLEEFEKHENEALVKWCQDFLLAGNSRQKYFIFQRFATFYLNEEPTKDGNNGDSRDCKWQRSHLDQFIDKMMLWAQPSISF